MHPLAEPFFRSEEEAYQFVEHHIWPQGAICPRCGNAQRTGRLKGASTRIGTYKCYRCRKPFTVKIDTMFESSHVPMHVWLKAIFLLSSSDGRIKVGDLQRILEVSPKTAMLMIRRIEQALQRYAEARSTIRPAPTTRRN
jgi:transposase-like protein